MAETVGTPALFTGLVDLASALLGGEAVASSDDFFAGKENLLKPSPAEFNPSTYTDRGKEMDGWESRRKRVPGHDWCIIKLGVPGAISAVDIDTAHFLGNHGPFAALDGCRAPGADANTLINITQWTQIVAETPLKRGASNVCAVSDTTVFTHVRLHMVPDGGIARLRVYGRPSIGSENEEIDLAAVENGGVALVASDSFFSPMTNLILPGESTIMSNGWETRRSRPPGMDYIILKLGRPGMIARLTLQTHHFKGNYPDRAAVDGLYWPDAPPSMLVNHPDWTPLLPEVPLRADDTRDFPTESAGPFTHLRLRIFPDGGISRLRAWGSPTGSTPGMGDTVVSGLNAMNDDNAANALGRCCGAARWISEMLAARPFASRTQLFGIAEWTWWRLADRDWIEAFSHHPRIGADAGKLREKFGTTAAWSTAEQSGMAVAGDETIAALVQGNLEYERKFGYLFIVCASGLSATEMLARLIARHGNPPENEIRIAAGELMQITKLRLAKLGA